jgi:flagellar M-ring protein FliF
MPVVDVDRLKTQGRRFVDGFTPGQKAMTILGVVAVVLASMTFMRWASTPNYVPLYTGLSSEDAGNVTAELDAQNVDYKIAGDGGTIMVSKQDVYKTRISLSSKGIPASGGDSYALLDKQGITTDQFTRNVTYQRALQGELAKTIQVIDGVQGATVTLTIPPQSPFVGGSEDKATAAVLVKTNSTLPSSTVTAIVNLVASSIPNMNPDDVTVADSNGKVLHAPGIDASSGNQAEQQQGYEVATEKKVADMIAASIGPNKAAVTVTADLDTSKKKTTSKSLTKPATPGSSIPALEERTETETFTGAGAGNQANGDLGVGGNAGTPTGGGGDDSYNASKTTRKNAFDESVVEAEEPPGKVQKLSVSVLFDEAAVSVADAQSIWLPQIKSAVGYDEARDGADGVRVNSVMFDEAVKAGPADPAPAGGNAIFDLIKTFLTLLIVGLILFFAWKAIKKAETNRVPLRVPLDLAALESPQMQGLDQSLLAPARVGAAAVGAPERRIPLEPAPTSLEQEISELIESQPEEVAQTLRSWLADRRS